MIRLEGINKSFGRLHVLRDVSLEIQKGEVVCLIGPSGAGKSTLLRCINHLEPLDNGTIYIEGIPVYRFTHGGKQVVDTDRKIEALRSEVGMVFQSFNLFPHFTALENVMVAPIHVRREPKGEVRRRALALLAKVGLSDKVDAAKRGEGTRRGLVVLADAGQANQRVRVERKFVKIHDAAFR